MPSQAHLSLCLKYMPYWRLVERQGHFLVLALLIFLHHCSVSLYGIQAYCLGPYSWHCIASFAKLLVIGLIIQWLVAPASQQEITASAILCTLFGSLELSTAIDQLTGLTVAWIKTGCPSTISTSQHVLVLPITTMKAFFKSISLHVTFYPAHYQAFPKIFVSLDLWSPLHMFVDEQLVVLGGVLVGLNGQDGCCSVHILLDFYKGVLNDELCWLRHTCLFGIVHSFSRLF